jgi:hypothetical protein
LALSDHETDPEAGQCPCHRQKHPFHAGRRSSRRLADCVWASLLGDARGGAVRAEKPIQARKLSEIGRHVLRVTCSRCERIVEIQKADATRFYGADAIWREVAQRLLNNTCTERTGLHEEDGCWPSFE